MARHTWVVLLALGAVSCGQAFSAGGGGSAQGSSGTAESSGGTSSGSGGSASRSSNASTSMAASCGACPDNEYCDTSANACTRCTDYKRFHFAKPFQLTVPGPAGGGLPILRFPRMDAFGTLYFIYTSSAAPTVTRVAVTNAGKYPIWSGSLVMDTPPNPPTAAAANVLGPLPIAASVSLGSLGGPDTGLALLFDEPQLNAVVVGSGTPLRKVYAAGLSAGASTAPMELTLPGGAGTSQYRIAVATATNRYFWINAGGGSAELRTALVDGTTDAGSIAATTVVVKAETGVAFGLPNQPWVTADGTILLFATNYSATDVTPRLFWVLLGSDGQPVGNATRVFPGTQDSDGDPSLTPNACALVFARGGSLWSALRD